MSTLEVRVNAQAGQGDLPGGAALVGNIYSVQSAEQSRRDVVLPIGDGVAPAPFTVEPGRYIVEAALPSGRLLSHEVEVKAGQTVPVEFDATDSPNSDLSWQYIVGNVESFDVYHSESTVPVPQSRGAQTVFPGNVGTVVADGLRLPDVWCHGEAVNGIGFADVLEIAEGQPEWVFDKFTSAPWVDKHDEVSPSTDGDPASPLFRFTSATFPGLEAHATDGRRFLLARSEVGRFMVTLPVPWTDVRSGGESVVQVLANRRQSPFGNPFAVAVLDHSVGAGLAYLANGALSNAAALFGDVEQLLYEKMANPLAAAAGAYVLVGTAADQDQARWDRWIANLDSMFGFMSDGAILRAVRQLRMAQSEADLHSAREALLAAYRRGLPIFTLGISWLIDGLSEFPEHSDCDAALQVVRRLSWRVDMREPFVILRMGASK